MRRLVLVFLLVLTSLQLAFAGGSLPVASPSATAHAAQDGAHGAPGAPGACAIDVVGRSADDASPACPSSGLCDACHQAAMAQGPAPLASPLPSPPAFPPLKASFASADPLPNLKPPIG